jgi:hypothetical protein
MLSIHEMLSIKRRAWGSYEWPAWNPSDVVGTYTNAPGAGTADVSSSSYLSMSNSGGTLTITFNLAGKWMFNLMLQVGHSAGYASSDLVAYLGGTATRRYAAGFVNTWGPSTTNGNENGGANFLVIAESGQTLTVLPQYRVSDANTWDHTAYASVTVLWLGP